jgi:hypothetical protein
MNRGEPGTVVPQERSLDTPAPYESSSVLVCVIQPGSVRDGRGVQAGNEPLIGALPLALGRVTAGHPDPDGERK